MRSFRLEIAPSAVLLVSRSYRVRIPNHSTMLKRTQLMTGSIGFYHQLMGVSCHMASVSSILRLNRIVIS